MTPYGNIMHIVLQNRYMSVELTNIGCAVVAIHVPDRHGVMKNIVAGFDNINDYFINKDYFGCIVGRYANRIADGKFRLNGIDYQLTINDGNNHLHGGERGFSHQVWKVKELIEGDEECGVIFSYFSEDGNEGYPGNLSVEVKYLLNERNLLSVHYSATTDAATPVNLTNHSYFNLTGFETPDILNHLLWVDADNYIPKGSNNTPTGEIASLGGTLLDFRKATLIGERIHSIPGDMGYDHNYILNKTGALLSKAAVLSEESTGRSVTIYTDKPALQVYTGNYWNNTIRGRQGIVYPQHGGVALETQFYPDSPNHLHFPCTILQPGERYASMTVYEFGVSGV